MSAQVGSVPSRWRFTGQEEKSGLVYMQARDDDPVTVQFISLLSGDNSRLTPGGALATTAGLWVWNKIAAGSEADR